MKIKNKLDVNLYEHGGPEDYLTTSVFLDELENSGAGFSIVTISWDQ